MTHHSVTGMGKNRKKKSIIITFSILLVVIMAIFAASMIKTDAYNRTEHRELFSGSGLFGEEEETSEGISVKAVPRSSTWTKTFTGTGLTGRSFQAYTYDFFVTNNTRDEVSDFRFRLDFSQETFLMSAWNGALEIHQQGTDSEYVATVPDLREFHAEDYTLDTITCDGEVLVHMKAGDYLVYIPSASVSAMEVPIKPHEGAVPGIILYVAAGTDIHDSTLELEYTLRRLLNAEPLFWISLISLAVWMIALLIVVITWLQIRKYTAQYERDNEIIQGSIETFTGFIDAKDPYTNGHSNRVAEYTRLIAREMGYEGEELDRIYYVALLHDCGKIGVPDNILGKPGRLSSEEFEVIKSHTVCGGEILHRFNSLIDVGEGALYHHERYDGTGYPEGRTGEDIPLIARMICVADSFDAMNSDRVYRKKLKREEIIGEIERNKGKQFDPRIADILLGLIRDQKIQCDG